MPDTIVSTLEYKSAIWLQQFKKAVTHFKLDAKGYGFELSVGATVNKNVPPIKRLNVGKLPPYIYLLKSSVVYYQ